MNIPKFALSHRLMVGVFTITLLFVGILAAFTLGRREDPDVEGRVIQILARFPGASASQVESLVVDPLERTLLEVGEVDVVKSVSRPAFASLEIETTDQATDSDIENLRNDIRDRVSDLQPELPQNATVEVNDRFYDTAAIIIAVSNPKATPRELERSAKRVRDGLRVSPLIAEVNLVGEQEQVVTVSLSSGRAAQLGVSTAQVSDAISARNALPQTGGSVALGASRLGIESSGDLVDTPAQRAVAQIRGVVVAPAQPPSNSPIYLRDVASVSRGYADPPTLLMRANGARSVGVWITMREGRNIASLGKDVEKRLVTLRKSLPPGTQLTTVNNLPENVAGRMSEFWSNLGLGFALVFAVMWSFMGLRPALMVGVMLIITVIGALGSMLLLGRELHQTSIAALIITIGLVVDNTIVVLDNIEVKLRDGLDRARAVLEGTSELQTPLLASNLTTIAAFGPLLLLPGATGEFVDDIAIVPSVASGISLFLNLCVTPILAERFLQKPDDSQVRGFRKWLLKRVEGLRDLIAKLAATGLKRPILTSGLAFGAFGLAIFLLPRLGVQFIPPATRAQFTVEVRLPEGRDILETSRLTERVEAILAAQMKEKDGEPGAVKSFATYVGGGGPRFFLSANPEPPTPNYAQIVVNTTETEQAAEVIEAVRKAAKEIPDALIIAKKLEAGPPIGAPIAIRLAGTDSYALRAAGEQIKARLSGIEGAYGIFTDYAEVPLGLQIDVKEEQAALAGLSSQEISRATQLGFSGAPATYLREGDEQIPVVLRFAASERERAESLEDAYLTTQNGDRVPLRQVADVRLAPQEARIARRNRVKTLTVFANVLEDRLPAQVLGKLRADLQAAQPDGDGKTLPGGVKLSFGGEDEEVGTQFGRLVLVLGFTVALNFAILAWEFNQLRVVLTILLTASLSLIGAVLGLFIARQSFGFIAFLGVISLAGVATNHAIVLFEYALEGSKGGGSMDTALVEAGRERLRPVLLTVVLAIGSQIPQALDSLSIWPPLAWASIFGLLVSLFLTLAVAPSLFKTLSIIIGEGKKGK